MKKFLFSASFILGLTSFYSAAMIDTGSTVQNECVICEIDKHGNIACGQGANCDDARIALEEAKKILQ